CTSRFHSGLMSSKRLAVTHSVSLPNCGLCVRSATLHNGEQCLQFQDFSPLPCTDRFHDLSVGSISSTSPFCGEDHYLKPTPRRAFWRLYVSPSCQVFHESRRSQKWRFE